MLKLNPGTLRALPPPVGSDRQPGWRHAERRREARGEPRSTSNEGTSESRCRHQHVSSADGERHALAASDPIAAILASDPGAKQSRDRGCCFSLHRGGFVDVVAGESEIAVVSDTGSATAGGVAAALMLATSRLLASTGRPQFGRGSPAGVERASRARCGSCSGSVEMHVVRSQQGMASGCRGCPQLVERYWTSLCVTTASAAPSPAALSSASSNWRPISLATCRPRGIPGRRSRP